LQGALNQSGDQAAQATEIAALFHDAAIAVVWPQNQSDISHTSLNYHQTKKAVMSDERHHR